MGPTERHSDTTVLEEASRPRFQFSLLDFLVAVTLISIGLGPALHFFGIRALVPILGIAIAVTLLAGTAHIIAEWLLASPKKLPPVFATSWFWFALGIVLIGITTSEILELLDRFIGPEMRKPQVIY